MRDTVSHCHICFQARSLTIRTLLRRDGYRCCIPGAPDAHSLFRGRLLDEGPGDAAALLTQAAHILPYSLSTFADETHAVSPSSLPLTQCRPMLCMLQKARPAIPWAVLKAWAPKLDLDGLLGEGINEERNAFTLSNLAHECFGAFDLWFEAEVSLLFSVRVQDPAETSNYRAQYTGTGWRNKDLVLPFDPRPITLFWRTTTTNITVCPRGASFGSITP